MTAYARQLQAAQRAHDNACDCCGHVAPAIEESMKPALPFRLAYRRARGRSTGSISYFLPNGGMETAANNRDDPLRQLYCARRFARSPGYGAMHYGEIRQRVVSPVLLPADLDLVA